MAGCRAASVLGSQQRVRGESSLPTRPRRPRSWGPQRPSVVLEPIDQVDDASNIEIVAASIHGELLTLLGSLLDVLELRDARRQEGPVDGYVLSGSVIDSDSLRVSAQLTATADQTCLWSGRFRFRQRDALNAVKEIAIKVVEALPLRLRDEHWSDIWSGHATSTDVWTTFQKGRLLESQTTLEGLMSAIRQYEDCLSQDPAYVPAHVAVGFCRLDMIRLGMDES